MAFQLRAVRPAPSPERAALAEAIADRSVIVAKIVATQSALDAARTALGAAREARGDAHRGIEAAKAAAGQHMAEAGGTGTRPPGIREARDALTAAEDYCDIAQIAVDALAARLVEAEQREPFARRRVEVAALAAARSSSETERLIAEVEKLQKELFAKGTALAYLHRIGAVDRAQFGSNPNVTATAADLAVQRLGSPVATWSGLASETLEPAWRTWIEALSIDADAKLPAGLA